MVEVINAGDLPIHMWEPEDPHGGGIVLVHEIFGVTPYIQRRAQQLADLGYAVYVPELFWRSEVSTINEVDEDALSRAVALSGETDWDDAVADVVRTMGALEAHISDPVMLLGFCYGGGVAYEAAARKTPQALVSYYGSALPQLLHLSTPAPSLHHFGVADSYISGDQVAAIEQVVTAQDAQLFRYDGADHAFDNPHPMFHHPAASELAWARTVEFLEKHRPDYSIADH